MPDDRGYVVVRPDGTPLWFTARVDAYAAWKAAGEGVCVFGTRTGPTSEQLQAEGYMLRRCRVEGEHD